MKKAELRLAARGSRFLSIISLTMLLLYRANVLKLCKTGEKLGKKVSLTVLKKYQNYGRLNLIKIDKGAIRMLKKLNLSTPREGFIKITREIQGIVSESGVKEGICIVYCPHTTAGVTINENADPDVVRDMTLAMNTISPDRPEYRHAEGNSHAHVKALLTGSSVTVIISGGKLMLGKWQGIYFAEYDGPRNRNLDIKIIEG